jgi:hypothetical protein
MPSYPLPDGPHNDPWKSLLSDGFAVVDDVVRTHGVDFPIRIGGGSMLLRRYRHRKSKDLDLFVTDARLARWCSPRHNETAGELFADYGEEATSVKLITGMQEIDIIVAAPVVEEDGTETVPLLGRDVAVERPREILAKKVVYRGRLLQPRDVFDLACIAQAEPDEIAAVLPWLSLTHVADLDSRLAEIEPILGRELADKVEPYPEFAPLLGQCLEIARGVVLAWRENLVPRVKTPRFPAGTHRAVYSRDGRTVVIKERDATGRFEKIGNPLGPAMVGPEGSFHYLGGTRMSAKEWRNHPDVIRARGKGKAGG